MVATGTLSFVLILLALFICRRVSASNRTTSPTVVIHVGPHKTGSTHVQGSILALDGLIRNRTSYMQPFIEDSQGFINLKMQSFYSNELRNLETTDFRYLNQLKTFLHIAHQHHNNVLISSEDLSSIPLDGASYLSNMVHNFQPKVVITFRDSLSRALSEYREIYPRFALSDEVHLPDFRVFVQNNLESMRVYYSNILDLYAKEFGEESLVLIDYDGAIAAKKELVYIILCEICKILCDPGTESSVREGASHNDRRLEPS